jgi:hypothetical protein
VPDPGDSPDLAVSDLQIGVVASRRDPVSEPDPTAGGSDDLGVRVLVALAVIADGSVELRDLFASASDDQIARGAGVGERCGSFHLAWVDHDPTSAVEGVNTAPGSSPLRIRNSARRSEDRRTGAPSPA